MKKYDKLLIVVLAVLMFLSCRLAAAIHDDLHEQIILGRQEGELLEHSVYQGKPAFIVKVDGRKLTYVLPEKNYSDYYQRLIDEKISNVKIEVVSYYYRSDVLKDRKWGKELLYIDTLTVEK